MLEYFIRNSLLIYILEIGAAVAGTFYLKRIEDVTSETRLFVYFLWFTVFVETVGIYPSYAYFNDYSTLSFIKDTPFERNYWWYNSFNIIKFNVYFIFFIAQLDSQNKRKIFNACSLFFTFSAVINLLFSGIFFTASSAYTAILGTFLLCFMVMIYFYEMLNGDKILNFYKHIPFYVAIGVLVWHLVVTPLFIYSQYFSSKSPDFVALHTWVLTIMNIYLYGIFIIGFILNLGKRHGRAA